MFNKSSKPDVGVDNYTPVKGEILSKRFANGSLLLDVFYQIQFTIRPENPKHQGELDGRQMELFMPGMAGVDFAEIGKMCHKLENDLNTAIKEEDSPKEGKGDIFRVRVFERNFSGGLEGDDAEETCDNEMFVPYIIPKAYSIPLDGLHKDLFEAIKKISIEIMTEIFDREVIVDEDYKPSDFDYK